MSYVFHSAFVFAFLLAAGCSPNNATPAKKPLDSDSGGIVSTENRPDQPVDPSAPVADSSIEDGSIVEGKPAVVAGTEPAATGSSEYRLLSWNVESEGADSSVIAAQLQALNLNDRYDVLALTEVMPADLGKFQDALGEHYKYVYSKSGNNDRLEILYNEAKFELVRQLDLNEINILERYRAPLVAHLKDRSSGTEFMVMVNHLARGKAEIRQQQATMLVEWARDQTLPVFAIGDYNFDFVFETRKGNPAFENMLRDNIWRWIEPSELIDTNWYDNPEQPDGEDDYPGSILDFAFVAGPAKDWTSVCNVIVREGDFPDNEKTSDHRPFELIISK